MLKANKPERKKPRAMPVETIVTRFKSKQKLLEKEQSNTTNNVKRLKTNKKIVSSQTKVINQFKHMEVAEKKEIYANKLRRNIVNKKIMLVPRHSYKVIGRIKGCNKRKLRTPQKEITFPMQRHNSNSSNEIKYKQTDISITDMVKIIEDSKSLDDEDLLEILTCPSPVWWEDPPDGYIEEAIFSRPQQKFEQKSIKTQILEEQIKQEQNEIEKKAKEDLYNQILEVKIENNKNLDKTFVKKRSKLEVILDNIIKTKTKKENKLESNLPNKIENSAIVKSNSTISKSNSAKSSTKLKKRIQKTQIKRKIVKTKLKNKTKLRPKQKKYKLINKSKKKRNSDSFKLSDIEDDILKHLENMDIPIQDKNETNLDINKGPEGEKNIQEKVITSKNTKENEIKDKKNKEKDIKDKETKEKDIKNKEKVIREVETKEKVEVRRISIDSNKSDRVTDEAEYLDMSVFDEIIKNKSDYTKHLQFNEVSNSKGDDTEYVTVYKIISNETNNDINELKIMLPVERKHEKYNDGTKINDYYKHCKKVNIDNEVKLAKNDEKSVIVSKNESKASEKFSILISEIDSIKYCFVCSSIFDKDTCDYCEKKNFKKKKLVIFCDACGSKMNSKQEMVKHLESHR